LKGAQERETRSRVAFFLFIERSGRRGEEPISHKEDHFGGNHTPKKKVETKRKSVDRIL